MDMNSTPVANRIHIGFFGCRNAGKSSLVNAVTGQEIAVVSDVKGTTTDPVTKTMELLPLGPVVIIDTPGFDDEGDLGEKRVLKTKQILNKTDLAVLVVDGCAGLNEYDQTLRSLFEEKKNPNIPDRFWKNHIISTFVETLTWWIRNGMQESPEVLTEYFFAVV